MTRKSAADETSSATTDVAPVNNVDEIVMTFESLKNAANNGVIDVVSASALTDQDGFIYMDTDRKADLVGSPFFIVKVQAGFSKSYGDFVTVWIVTARGNKLKFVDFSTGVRRMLEPMLNEQGESPEGIAILCENGLSRSDYDADPETGRPGGTTYYLDTSGSGALPAGQL